MREQVKSKGGKCIMYFFSFSCFFLYTGGKDEEKSTTDKKENISERRKSMKNWLIIY